MHKREQLRVAVKLDEALSARPIRDAEPLGLIGTSGHLGHDVRRLKGTLRVSTIDLVA